MFEKWLGQRGEHVLDARDSEAFLNEHINVSHIHRGDKTVPGGVKVYFTNMSPLRRITFLRGFAVWAAVVLAGAAIYAPNIFLADNDAVAAAMDKLETTYPTADAFNHAYWAHTFDGTSTDLGYYAKNGPALGSFKVGSREPTVPLQPLPFVAGRDMLSL